jgi:hypothetical protein
MQDNTVMQAATLNLVAAIETFNRLGRPRIELRQTGDGRTVATLPRIGREIIVQGSKLHPQEVSAQDIALLCEEAQSAIAPGMALLEAALAAMGRVARDEEDEVA